MALPRTACIPLVLAALCAAFGGCSSRTNVSATGNSSPLYSHVYITAQAVWFNRSASAGPDDGGWVKFPLTTPVTVDLVADSGGSFGALVTDLKVEPGSYSQVRFIPVDASVPLTTAAQTLGAQYNMEADYVDGAGNEHQLPLELLNPDKGLGIQASLTVPFGSVGAALASTGTTTDATTAGATTTGTTTIGTTASVSSSSTTTTTAQFALSFDAARDLSAFSYLTAGGTAAGVLLSSHVSAYDLSQSGGIQGQLTLTSLTGITSANGTPGIEVSAEALSADGTRHYVVASAPVASDGSFTLYPLSANASNNVSYDLVIHGAGIATIVLKNILIPPTGSSATSTTGSTATTNPDTAPITPSNLVSVGTLIPRAAGTYTTNIAAATGAPLPAGAEVAFYQTLPNSGEVPYVIEAAPIDPFNQVLDNPQALSTGTVDSGTYVSSGATITVVSAAPQEHAGTYQVAATAPLYADGLLGIEVAAPTTAGVTTAAPVTVAALALASGNVPATVSASVKPASALEYDHGELMLSQNGQLIATVAIDTALKSGGSVQLQGVPGGTADSIYYVTVRAWNSTTGKLTRQWYDTALDLRSATSASIDLTVN